MGTTLTSLQNDGTTSIVWVAAIEGYVNLLTSTSDTDAVETAWSATDWATAHSGLEVRGDFEQAITPWDPRLEPNTIELVVHKDNNVTEAKSFATRVHIRAPSADETASGSNAGLYGPASPDLAAVETPRRDHAGPTPCRGGQTSRSGVPP